ncbi:MAG: ABC transporter permease [Verrucomicrobiales bacterium]|nr:ABC transporter permease [Verrucomicrobiales bacterium]
MNWLQKIRLRFRALFQKEKLDTRMDDEMRSHIEMQTQENIEAGMKPEEARYAALRQFGWIESIKETCREQRGVSWIENLGQDIRFGARQLLKNPGFTAVAVLTLALGIGANTAIFTVMNTLMLRSLPVKDPHELVTLAVVTPASASHNFSYPFYEQLRDGNRNLSGLFAAGGTPRRRMLASAFGAQEVEFVRAQEVTGNFFSVLGVSAALGRTFTAADDTPTDPQAVAVVSHSFWKRRFGGNTEVIGKAITLEDVSFTIVGVTPPGFFGFQPGETPDLWWPMQMVAQVDKGPWGQRLKRSEAHVLRLMGRVPAQADRRHAQAELDLIIQQRFAEDGNKLRTHLELQPGHAGFTRLRETFRKPLLVLMGVVSAVLLIACANVANLLLGRAAARQREFSVRSALGAGRRRLVRQLLTEGLVLAALGSLLGLLLAQGGTRALLLLMRLQPDGVSFNLTPDARVLLFTMGASLLTGLIFSLAPAWHSTRIDLASALKGTAGSVAGNVSRQKFNQTLVVAQVALSVVLLIGGGLFVRTLEKLKGSDFGFQRENVVLFDIELTRDLDEARESSLTKELLMRLEALPSVKSASLSSFYLVSGGVWTEDIIPEGYAQSPGEGLTSQVIAVGPRFFETMGTAVLTGREFSPQDERPAGVPDLNNPRTAVINESIARRYFAGSSPIGKRLHFGEQAQPTYEIVGVVRDVRHRSLRESAGPTLYVPLFQGLGGMGITFSLRTTGQSESIRASLSGVVREMDPTVRVRDVRTMDDLVSVALRQERILAQLGGFFSLFALGLACLGLYGVLALAVVQRTREIGVRVALGAQRRDVLSLVIGKGLSLALVGCILGLIGAFVVTRLAKNLLYGVTPTDPLTFVGVTLLLILIATLASWLPARRATKVHPMVALRYE